MALKLSELGASLRKAIEPLVLALNPEFVLLFGSFAYGEPHKHSDVDLLIVLPQAPNPDGFSARLELVMQHLAWSDDLPTYELHIMTLDEFRRELLKRNVFIAEIVQKGVPLFSRRDWDEVLREVRTLLEAR
jgi:predicted nucleotidyltransferase